VLRNTFILAVNLVIIVLLAFTDLVLYTMVAAGPSPVLLSPLKYYIANFHLVNPCSLKAVVGNI
jgi:hypothetical protein